MTSVHHRVDVAIMPRLRAYRDRNDQSDVGSARVAETFRAGSLTATPPTSRRANSHRAAPDKARVMATRNAIAPRSAP